MEDLILVFTSLTSAVAAAMTSIIAILLSRQQRQLDARSQAGQVFARLEETPGGGASWVLENRGDRPIYEVRLEVPDSDVSFEVLSPGEQRVTADDAFLQDRDSLDPVLTFKDAEDRRWRVGRSGVKETRKEEKPEVFKTLTVTTAATLLGVLCTIIGAVVSFAISQMR